MAPSSAPPEPKYYGNLDVYATTLPGLGEIYLPIGQSFPQFEDVYHALLAYQAKSLHTGRCYLPPDSVTSEAATGRWRAACVYDPVAEKAFDVGLREIVETNAFKFNTKVRNLFPGPACRPAGAGVSAKTYLQNNYIGVKGSAGVFKLKRVWVKTDPRTAELQELFEGYFSLRVSYDPDYRKKKIEEGAKFSIAFWAVRAARDVDGKEIGLVPQ
ncbi:hypothetical protein GLOTRDRAFT_96913 [Gloeophyllum trabeum ATCC 11539]|uniref:Uncharacterized protein n=1 Tax=Gloeophyllum trabeum (strain ATCC 11539 / FP-39264 / Madison 617) TaxID=670483 RepID=S7PS83_GLOTA|nr:uncharacterized protein GLOTRDRAFT_96913 [Gloeophyllum trabeum ATCC 11539]EPQ50666.1 hypothetical protein GLOTRDRAFT_96913 [Gloeophyllum trabeum ATCC 11539]